MGGVSASGNNGSVPSFAQLGPVAVNVDPGFLNNPIVQDIVKILENLSKSVFSGAPAGETGPFGKTIDVHIQGVTVSLPNPLYRLDSFLGPLGSKIASLAEFLRKVGQFLTGGMRDLGNGSSVSVPGLNQRLGAINNANTGILSAIGAAGGGAAASGLGGILKHLFGGGGADGTASAANLPTFGNEAGSGGVTDFPASSAGDLYGGAASAGEVFMTQDESASFAKMTPPEQAQYMLQKKMEAHARMVALLTNLMTMLHDTLMGIFQNIKS